MSRASASPARARSTASAMLDVTESGDRPGKLALEPGGGAEMMEQIGVRSADFRGDRFQRDRLRAIGKQEPARRLDGGGSAFFRAQSLASC